MLFEASQSEVAGFLKAQLVPGMLIAASVNTWYSLTFGDYRRKKKRTGDLDYLVAPWLFPVGLGMLMASPLLVSSPLLVGATLFYVLLWAALVYVCRDLERHCALSRRANFFSVLAVSAVPGLITYVLLSR